MALAKRSEYPEVAKPDRISAALGMHGSSSRGGASPVAGAQDPAGLVLFFFIGILAGMFGWGRLGQHAGAESPHGRAPEGLGGTSSFILSLVDSSAAWVYLHKGAVLPMIACPR